MNRCESSAVCRKVLVKLAFVKGARERPHNAQCCKGLDIVTDGGELDERIVGILFISVVLFPCPGGKREDVERKVNTSTFDALLCSARCTEF